MKHILNKDLPTFKAGTEARISKRGNLLTKVDVKKRAAIERVRRYRILGSLS